ncbi:aminopeptidase P family protein [Desulfoplanes sp.]
MFESGVYIRRRAVLCGGMGEGILLFPGHGQVAINSPDNLYPFRQDSSFLYYFGLSVPGLVGVIDAGTGTSWLFGPPTRLEDAIWTGPVPSIGELAEQSGVDHGCGLGDLDGFLAKVCTQKATVHFLPPYRSTTRLDLERLLGLPHKTSVNGGSQPLARAVIAQRSVKSPREIEQIEAALNISSAMYSKAFGLAVPGTTEQQIKGAIEAEVVMRGARRSFAPIVTTHGHILHNPDSNNTLARGDLLLIDSGAETAMGYASDITRTLPVGGCFSSMQRDIYAVVLAAQEAAIAALAPGVPFKAAHMTAARTVVQGLKDIGLMEGDVDGAVEAGAHALFFVHGLGHMLGLDVHDMESLGEDLVGYDDQVSRSPQFGLHALRLARRVEEGFVLTVEPGIYFIPGLIGTWERKGWCSSFIRYEKLAAYHTFGGIRIEDDVLVMRDRARVLGPSIPKQIKEIERNLG